MSITNLVGQPEAASIAALPEFVDAKGLRALFGISRSYGYYLSDAGLVKTISLRRPGTTRGKQLWDCQSVRDFLRANIDEKAEVGCRIKARRGARAK
jgi:hypothetical protein